MELRKYTQPERRRPVFGQERDEVAGDTLFEREWEVFVVRLDPETGRFQTETICEDEVPERV